MKISIITAAYNSEEFIECCLRSVQNQTYRNIEHIIIDGASEDNTLEIIKKNSTNNTIVLSEPDGGVYDAMNKGLAIATGDVVAFLNSDDFYSHCNVLSNVALVFSIMEHVGICYSDLIYCDRTNINEKIRFWKCLDFQAGLFSKGWSPPHPTFFARRSLYSTHGYFDLSYRIAADVDLMIRFLEVYKVPSYYYRDVFVTMRTGGISNKNFSNILLQNIEVCKSLDKNKVDFNYLTFIAKKIINRICQFKFISGL